MGALESGVYRRGAPGDDALINRITYQGTVCYVSPSFGGQFVAVNLRTIKRWIDQAIASGEIREA